MFMSFSQWDATPLSLVVLRTTLKGSCMSAAAFPGFRSTAARLRPTPGYVRFALLGSGGGQLPRTVAAALRWNATDGAVTTMRTALPEPA